MLTSPGRKMFRRLQRNLGKKAAQLFGPGTGIRPIAFVSSPCMVNQSNDLVRCRVLLGLGSKRIIP